MMDGVNNSQFVFYRPENKEEEEKRLKEYQIKKQEKETKKKQIELLMDFAKQHNIEVANIVLKY